MSSWGSMSSSRRNASRKIMHTRHNSMSRNMRIIAPIPRKTITNHEIPRKTTKIMKNKEKTRKNKEKKKEDWSDDEMVEVMK